MYVYMHFFNKNDQTVLMRRLKFAIIVDRKKHKQVLSYRNLSRNVGKPTLCFLTRSDTNQAVQPLELARGLKCCI